LKAGGRGAKTRKTPIAPATIARLLNVALIMLGSVLVGQAIITTGTR
jgi:hypothetical protein